MFFKTRNISADTLMQEASLSHGAAVNVLKELSEQGEIILTEKSGTSVGRKKHCFSLNPDYRHICTVSVTYGKKGYTYTFRIMDQCGNTLILETKETECHDLNDILPLLEAFLRTRPKPDLAVVSTPGICLDGTVSLNGSRYPLQQMIEASISPCIVENDVNTAVIGCHSAYPDHKSIALIYQPENTIFGCGIIINNELYRGSAGAAGELRYLPFMRYTAERTAWGLLKEQVIAAAAVLNPELIAYCSRVTGEPVTIEEEFLPAPFRPELIRITDPEPFITGGMYSAAVTYFINHPEVNR